MSKDKGQRHDECKYNTECSWELKQSNFILCLVMYLMGIILPSVRHTKNSLHKKMHTKQGKLMLRYISGLFILKVVFLKLALWNDSKLCIWLNFTFFIFKVYLLISKLVSLMICDWLPLYWDSRKCLIH